MFDILYKSNSEEICFITKPTKRCIILSDTVHSGDIVIDKKRFFLNLPSIIFHVKYDDSFRRIYSEDNLIITSALVINNNLYNVPLLDFTHNYLCIGSSSRLKLFNNLELINDNDNDNDDISYVNIFLDLFWQTKYSIWHLNNLIDFYVKGGSLDEWEKNTKQDNNYLLDTKFLNKSVESKYNKSLFKGLNYV